MRPLTHEEREAVYLLRWKKRPDAMTVLPPVLPWERAGYTRAEPVVRKPRLARKRHVHTAEDTSPTHIRKIRAAFCEEFIRTGEINTALQQQLKDYANECRASAPHSDRVPPGHEADCPSERRDNDGGRCISGHPTLMSQPPDASVSFFGRSECIIRERGEFTDDVAGAPPYRQWLEIDMR